MATKQQRKTAARKARQRAALAAMVKHTGGSIPMVPTRHGLMPVSIAMLPQRAKQRIVETYEKTRR